jgi:hypothetical protein
VLDQDGRFVGVANVDYAHGAERDGVSRPPVRTALVSVGGSADSPPVVSSLIEKPSGLLSGTGTPK